MTPVISSGRCTPFSMGMKSGSQMKEVMGEGSSPYAHPASQPVSSPSTISTRSPYRGPESARRMRTTTLSPYGQMTGSEHEGAHSAGIDYFEPQRSKKSIASTSSGVPYRGPESARRMRTTTLSSYGQMAGGEREGVHSAGIDQFEPQRSKESIASTSSGVPYRGPESARRMRTTTLSSYGQMAGGEHGRSTPSFSHMSAHEDARARANQEMDQGSGLLRAPDATDMAFNQKPTPRLVGAEACNLFHKARASTGIPWYEQYSSQNAPRSVQSAKGALGSRSGNGAMNIEPHPASFADRKPTPRVVGAEAYNLSQKGRASAGIPWYEQYSSQNAPRSAQSARGALGSRSGNGAMSIEPHPASFAESRCLSAGAPLLRQNDGGEEREETYPHESQQKMVTINANPRLEFNDQRIKTNKSLSSSTSLGRVPENYAVQSHDLLTDQFAPPPRRPEGGNAGDGSLWSPHMRSVGSQTPDANVDGNNFGPQQQVGHHAVKHLKRQGSTQTDAREVHDKRGVHHDEREISRDTSSVTSLSNLNSDERESSKDSNNRGMIPGWQQQPFCADGSRPGFPSSGRPSGLPNFSSSLHNVMGKAARRPLGLGTNKYVGASNGYAIAAHNNNHDHDHPSKLHASKREYANGERRLLGDRITNKSSFMCERTGELLIPNPQVVPDRRRDYAHSLIKANNRFLILAPNFSRSTRSPRRPVGLSNNGLKMSPSAPTLGTPDLFTHCVVARPELARSRSYVRWKY